MYAADTLGSRYNEALRRSERHLDFNVDALMKLASKAVGQATEDLTNVVKIAEGGLNRVFRFTFRDSTTIVARVPYQILLPKSAATASEVATMNFVRSHGIPVPRVYAYSSDETNTVGAEYIIMEDMPGHPIGDRWYTMSKEQRLKLIIQIVKLEAKLFSIPLPASGSIYYPRDLGSGVEKIDLLDAHGELYCVGPSVALALWFGKRSQLDIVRGPFQGALDAYMAGAKKEIAYLEKFSFPRYPFGRIRREAFDFRKQSPEGQLENLHKFLEMAPSMIPDNIHATQSLLRHP
ncbi:hypothetical protein MBLNU459_g7632t1 [Dothideomycetes sp. NU459]